MSNKRKLVAAGAAAGAVLWVRQSRRVRAGRAAAGIAEAILPTVASDAAASAATIRPRADEAHAPGHSHLAVPTHVREDDARSRRQEHEIAHREPELKRRS